MRQRGAGGAGFIALNRIVIIDAKASLNTNTDRFTLYLQNTISNKIQRPGYLLGKGGRDGYPTRVGVPKNNGR